MVSIGDLMKLHLFRQDLQDYQDLFDSEALKHPFAFGCSMLHEVKSWIESRSLS
jgi:hypothetical protein